MGSSIPLLLFFFFTNSALFLFSDAIPSHLQSLPTMSFDEGYTQIFGDSNLVLHRDGKTVHIALDERTGAGFASQDLYLHGFFSSSIKLPSDYAAGVVVAFYMSNGDLFEKKHDELDFEFLGNIRGREWRVQTNVYGNGSTAVGREERYDLWFDPTEDFHRYSIQWAHDRIIFYIDNIPIRNIEREPMSGDFPTKPMSLYATIWDGSGWATSGGRYGVNYKYAPYIAEFAGLVLHGCAVDPTDIGSSACDSEPDHHTATIPTEQRAAMDRFRRDHMFYSYCDDRDRYPTPPPECGVDRHEAKRLRTGGTRYRDRRNHHGRRHQGRHYRRSPAGREDAAL